jgi:hypothetical protein
MAKKKSKYQARIKREVAKKAKLLRQANKKIDEAYEKLKKAGFATK